MAENKEEAISLGEPLLSDSDPLLAPLNPEQREAVTVPADATLQILAGPGTGKTKTLCHRVAWLICRCGIDPKSIMLVTFTNQAAHELGERVTHLLGKQTDYGKQPSSPVLFGTFHGLCLKFLKKHFDKAGLPRDFAIADDAAQKRIINRVLRSEVIITLAKTVGYEQSHDTFFAHSYRDTPRAINTRIVRNTIDLIKSSALTIEEWAEGTGVVPEGTELPARGPLMRAILTEYQNLLDSAGLVDFGDLLLRALNLFRNHPEVTKDIQHVLVDEYQDTDSTQYALIEALAKPTTIVGDPDQSIYSFRAAQPRNFMRMRKSLPDETPVRCVYLTINYRSPEAVLALSELIIKQDKSRIDADRGPLRANKSLKDNDRELQQLAPVEVAFRSPYDEARAIAAYIKQLVVENSPVLRYSDFSILLRFRLLMDVIELGLTELNIPYKLTGVSSFWARREIQAATNFLCIFHSDRNDLALVETLKLCRSGIGDTTLTKLEDLNISKYPTLMAKLRAAVSSSSFKCILAEKKIRITRAAYENIAALLAFIDRCRKILTLLPYPESLDRVFELITTGEYPILELVSGSGDKEDGDAIDKRRHNLELLRARLLSLEGDVDPELLQGNGGPDSPDYLGAFLQLMALNHVPEGAEEENDKKEKQNLGRVTISTIHGAKGLEWPVVFLPRLAETTIRSENFDEECRLLYVSVTRARAICLLTDSTKAAPSFYDDCSNEDEIAKKRQSYGTLVEASRHGIGEPRKKFPSPDSPFVKAVARALDREEELKKCAATQKVGRSMPGFITFSKTEDGRFNEMEVNGGSRRLGSPAKTGFVKASHVSLSKFSSSKLAPPTSLSDESKQDHVGSFSGSSNDNTQTTPVSSVVPKTAPRNNTSKIDGKKKGGRLQQTLFFAPQQQAPFKVTKSMELFRAALRSKARFAPGSKNRENI